MDIQARTKLFGTDGIRGHAGEPPLDPDTVIAIGQALADLLRGELIIGRDPRESSPWIFERLREGIETRGGRVRDAGVLPTPAVALLTQQTDAAGGVMISASHNSFEDNGIKVFGPNGQKLDDEDEARVEGSVTGRISGLSDRPERSTPPGKSPGVFGTDMSREVDDYIAALTKGFPDGHWLQGLRIVCDCANGATSRVGPRLLAFLGATVETIHSEPDGRNINADCGAVHPHSLIERVRNTSVDLGVAYDGDGDRAMFVTGSGRLIDGDGVLLVMARRLLSEGRFMPAEVVGTSMTNIALEHKLSEEGVRLHRVDVGDRYVFRKMVDDGISLGGETSGHVIFPDFGLSGDGLLTTLKLCQAMVETSMSLDALTRDWEPAPQLIKNIRVSEKTPLESVPGAAAKILEIEQLLDNRGRIVVRYSGTEPLLRIMIESDSAETNERLAGELARVVRETTG